MGFARFAGLLGLSSLLFLSACGVKETVVLNTGGLQHQQYPLAVSTVNGQFLPRGWMLDNFYVEGTNYKTKKGTQYVGTYALDANNDGVFESKVDEPLYDLRFIHQVHGGVIWLRSFPVSTKYANTAPRVIVEDIINDMATTNYEAVSLGNVDVVAQRFGTSKLAEANVNLAGKPGYMALIDVANVDQVQLNNQSRLRRVKLVVVQTGLVRTFSGSVGYPSMNFPVVLVAGYSNLPGDFQASVPDFDALLGRVAIGGYQGYAEGAPLVHAPAAAPAVVGAATSPAPASVSSAPTASTVAPASDPTPSSPAQAPSPPPTAVPAQ